ncbi:5-formyltetrahydrofolate cyclo-ligase [Thiomicrorhabdus aquaedulcis]|uniref:5-formyltetrahydrofolate cyclo-ligase n=1 Tax=Thiomicrorhabdus aquaedulcis TaxID=2211106 RepID=UPI000FD77E69|nr:5-formyltetrahydrofolate cyclo-ligase [Thiomicrorhabdus aquaedulcis]
MNPSQSIRQHLRLQRTLLNAEQQIAHQKAALAHFKAHIDLTQIQHIGVFLAQNGELETRALIEFLWLNHQNVYLPVLETRPNWHMGFAHYTAQSTLVPNRFNIDEPSEPLESHIAGNALDLVLVPLVGFDMQGNRLGMGGGFYDRTFEFKRLNPNQKPLLMGWAHQCQKVDKLTTENWDVPLDGVITEQGVSLFNHA